MCVVGTPQEEICCCYFFFFSTTPEIIRSLARVFVLIVDFLLNWFLTFVIHAKRGTFETFQRHVVRTITTT